MTMEKGSTHSKKTRTKLRKAMEKVVRTSKFRNTIYQLKAKVARNRKIHG